MPTLIYHHCICTIILCLHKALEKEIITPKNRVYNIMLGTQA